MESRQAWKAAKNGVLIVGAGLAGLTLALSLAKRGVSSTVVEKQNGISPSKWGILLYPVGIRIFHELGVLDDIKRLAMPLKDPEVDSHGETLAVLRTGAGFGELDFGMGVGPSEVRDVLMRHALDAGVEVLEGVKYSGIHRDGEGRIIGARVSAGGSESDISCALLVGADGHRSRLREDFGVAAESKAYPPGVGLLLRAEHGLDRFHMVLEEGCAVVVLPLTTDRLQLGIYARGATKEELTRDDGQAAKRRIAAAVPSLSKSVEAANVTFSDGGLLLIEPEEIWAKHLVVDGGVLVGDAAHSFHPGVGQGAQQAFLDASGLAPVVERCVSKGDFSKSALAEFEAPRQALMRFWKGNSRRLISTETAEGRYGRWWQKRYFRKAGELSKDRAAQDIIWGFRAPTRAEVLKLGLSLIF